MNIITRFAPSPTGFLHIGNLRTAIITWLYAKSNNGKFLLRIDDTDIKRSSTKYINAIKTDLKWIGIDWDLCFQQSNRMVKYEEAKNKLIKTGRLYPCYEDLEELSLKKKSLLSRNLPPIYDRSSLKLTSNQKIDLESRGIKPYWRFLLNNEDISWDDKIRGHLHFNSKNLSDPVLIRTDGTLTYSLASVVDDIEYGVTDVIRGEDHISNSAIQIQLFKALSSKSPNFSHISLMIMKDRKLSKRDGDCSIKNLRENGILPSSVINFLSKIGSSNNIKIDKNIQKLIKEFNFNKLSKSTVKYDNNELITFNIKLLHSMTFDEIKNHLKSINLNNINQEFWMFIRNNINSLQDIKFWHEVCTQDIKTKIVNIELINLAKKLLPNVKFDSKTWNLWINDIKKYTKLRGRKLFMPLRLALTGKEVGPELKDLMPFIDRELIIYRLDNNQKR